MTVDLTTRYLGLELAHPIMPSANPLCAEVGSLLRLEAAGASAVVLPSLFEEQIVHEEEEVARLMEFGAESFGEATGGYFPELDTYNTGPGSYLGQVSAAKKALSIPVIGSLNGTTSGGWIRYARQIEEAGADALELNVYLIATDPSVPGSEVEERYLELVGAVKESISIPLAVKVGPYFSSMAHMAQRLVAAGADGLVLFNRFYQPDIDLEDLRVKPDLVLSSSANLRLPLRWTAILRGRIDASLGLTTGVHTTEDALKALLAGADAVMMAAALLQRGPEHLGTVLAGVSAWLEEHGYESVEQIKGSLSQQNAPDPEAFERNNYMKSLVTFSSPTW